VVAASLVDWSIRKGKSGLFEDCGLGKTLQQLGRKARTVE